ncbi:probable tubulin polyglutamylase ttll-15 [Aplysia californica]|uniref:Probable tubulin polyglutamylase ttll-15 n=1 Tax=Aplysia californica TaxID=6500 RepID=A0ABM0K2V8_APLCA|nr:probable tubulin polyglutamylase ttll-15 [Aplysia californica]XP_005107489.1 probable tubulin polyglutamylase ttll-15 [Aplysia californica]
MKGGQYKMFQEFSSPAQHGRPFRKTNRMVYLVVAILLIGVMLTMLNIYELHKMRLDHERHHDALVKIPETEAKGSDQTYPLNAAPIVWLQGSPKSKNNGPTGYLKHVFRVFEKIGFSIGERLSDWLVMWSHDYPFVTYSKDLKNLKPYQKVNHFPGSGFVTNKASLAQSKLDFIPKAFEIPAKKKEFLEYAGKHKNTSWVQKSNKHRGIRIKKVEELDFSKDGTFIQEYVSNPLLIDGRKFDIGIYTVLTSISPLRVYFIGGDALFRFCPLEYFPFDDSIPDKYVIGDDYLPLWKVASLEEFFVKNGYTFKNSFDAYLRSIGKDPFKLWEKMYSAIRQVFLMKEKDLIKASLRYTSRRNFFEMVRFDFVVDDRLNVFLMEANMSPNLSSDHFPPNARLYEHVLYNLFGLVGVTHYTSSSSKKKMAYQDPALVSSADIHVFPDFCHGDDCSNNCSKFKCKLCRGCITRDFEIDLKLAFLEHQRRGSARRVFPPPMNQSEALAWTPDSTVLDKYNGSNRLMFMWFIGKCRLDVGWCH